eukprot:CAMPEP_0170059058 /NCGR_PEP_ID=MMETSP0019_2-20121128/1465_1 /TAXON_ID=98059 /ORGANISM="Dinobryon sp., Strain UTEXLB2267" /LENGTH=265 /DNA_ID=CAMNT_0010264187 /DNA_START=837 /DNA_END=1634 /DNA_ORIENTATION=+
MTVLDYEFKVMGALSTSSSSSVGLLESTSIHIQDENRFANLLGRFGQVTNIVSFIISFFGFSIVVHHFGVRHTLLVFPIVLFVAVVVTNLAPRLWVFFFLVSLLKGLIFSLQDPAKELLYIPTSEAIKYKAKAWIDVFGSRLAKAAGSYMSSWTGGDVHKLRVVSEIPCLVIAFFILVLSWVIGTDFQALVKSNTVIGETAVAVTYAVDRDGPIRNGLRPGDVGYDGYDLQLFEGVFEDDDDLTLINASTTPLTPNRARAKSSHF